MKNCTSCFNWKVYAGLAVVGLGVWAVAPNLIWTALPLLLVAACPLSMLLMMRGMQGGQCATQPAEAAAPADTARTRDEQIAALKERLALAQARREAIAAELQRLEADATPAVREAEAVARAADERARERA